MRIPLSTGLIPRLCHKHFNPLIVLAFLLLFNCSFAQSNLYKLLEDKPKLALVKKSINSMYNWEFEQANNYIDQLAEDIPNHPAVPFARGMVIYWQIAPVDFTSSEYERHLELLEEASGLAEKRLDIDEEDIEGQFFKMASRSLIMKHLADSGQPMKAIGEAKGVYRLMKAGFDLKDEYIEYYFTTGVYNYYREYYPEKYPAYKPFAVFFQRGDMELGLEQLRYSANNATFTRAEAYAYLTHIYLKYEENQDKAIEFAKELVSKYPKNLYFKVDYTEILLLSGKTEQVKEQIPLFLKSSDYYYQAIGYMYSGKLIEKEGEYNRALYFYKKAEKLVDKMSFRFAEQKTNLYYGMSYSYSMQVDYENAKKYYKLAKEHDINDYLKKVDKPDMKN